MKLLVFGGNGLLGSATVAAGLRRGHDVCMTFRKSAPEFGLRPIECDITDKRRVRSIIREFRPDVVVNCAAMTTVDECERNTQTAVDVNATAPAQMAQHVSDVDARFVHVSTDYVFAGDRRSPYDEGHQPDPIQVYGESKLAGERNVRQNHSEALIVRTSFLYGLRGDNNKLSGFPAWLLSNINDGEPVALFSDQWITPTNTTFAAKSILNLIETGISGLVHLAGSACMTPFEFGEIVADTAGHDTEKLSKAMMDEAEREAPRPSYTCLETSKLRRLIEVSPQGPREALRSFN